MCPFPAIKRVSILKDILSFRKETILTMAKNQIMVKLCQMVPNPYILISQLNPTFT